MREDQLASAIMALDNMDDYARMDIGVNAIGPRGVLERFINDVAALLQSIQADPVALLVKTKHGDFTRLGASDEDVVAYEANGATVSYLYLAPQPAQVKEKNK